MTGWGQLLSTSLYAAHFLLGLPGGIALPGRPPLNLQNWDQWCVPKMSSYVAIP